jgi:hypothetical protein
MTRDQYREATLVSMTMTLIWYLAGIAVWYDVQAPLWYRIPLSLGFGAVVWCWCNWKL